MNKKFTTCFKCSKKNLKTSLYCRYCGVKYGKNRDTNDIKRGITPLVGLRNGSMAMIVSVVIFSLMMWGIIELFSAIGDAFKF